MKGHLVIKRVQWAQRQEELRRLRHEVFVEEQGVPPEEEWDGQDEQAAHFLALLNDQPVACARLQPTGKLQRMAVAASMRRKGVGKALVKGVIAFARRHRLPNVYLDAQTHAVGFYTSVGFVPEGEEFKDAGIMHRRMSLQNTRVESGLSARLAGPSALLEALQTQLTSGRHSVDILSDQLAPALFDDESVTASIAAVARRSPRSRVRILVKDSRSLYGRQHGLVLLAQRLPSRVTVRRLLVDVEQPPESYVIVDRQAMVYLNSEASFTGFARHSARAEAQRLLEEFERTWEHYSDADPNLQRLHL